MPVPLPLMFQLIKQMWNGVLWVKCHTRWTLCWFAWIWTKCWEKTWKQA